MLSIATIRARLREWQPALRFSERLSPAAVALLLREAPRGLEVLFIERARHEGDPWSGDLAFPGGRVEREDGDPRRAAERETLEEIGVDLRKEEHLGRLDDLTGASLPVVVSCFPYAVRTPAPLVFNAEVADAFWFPLEELLNPGRRRTAHFRFRGRGLTHPAVQVLEDGRPLLWGITYRLVFHFLEVVGRTPPRSG